MKDLQRILNNILTNGKHRGDRTGTGTLSLFSERFVHDMRDGFPLPGSRETNFNLVIGEFGWIMSGETENYQLRERGVKFWGKWALPNGLLVKDSMAYNPERDLNAPYGQATRAFGWQHGHAVDQLQYVLHTLEANPESRRILISLWDPTNLPDESVSPQQNVIDGKPCLTPCHYGQIFYVEDLTFAERRDEYLAREAREGKSQEEGYQVTVEDLDRADIPTRGLSLKWQQRSTDSCIGILYNIAYYGFMLESIARKFNFLPLMLEGDLTNVHIYDTDLEIAKLMAERELNPLPRLEWTGPVKDIWDYTAEDVRIVGYEPVGFEKLKPAI